MSWLSGIDLNVRVFSQTAPALSLVSCTVLGNAPPSRGFCLLGCRMGFMNEDIDAVHRRASPWGGSSAQGRTAAARRDQGTLPQAAGRVNETRNGKSLTQ